MGKMSTFKIVEGLSAADYHAVKAVSASLLKAYAVTAEKGKAYEDGVVTISQETALFGSRFHCATLEPIVFASQYVERPATYPAPATHAKVKAGEIAAGHPLPWHTSAKVCEDWERQQTREAISASDYAAFQGMRQALLDDRRMRPYMLAEGKYELSLFAELDGIPVKARLDKLITDGAIVDLKSTQCAEPYAFTREIIKFHYDLQIYWYSMVAQLCGLPYNGMVLGACEKKPPYSVLCCELDTPAFNRGKDEALRCFELYKKCHKDKRWPGYIDQAAPYQVAFPSWYLTKQQPAEQVLYYLES
jgi:hypothetical protein